MRRTIPVCAVLGSLASGRVSASAEDRTIVPPPGEYRMVTLVLENGGPMFHPMWGNSLARREGDLIVRRAFRDGRIRIPGRLSVRQIVGELRADAGTIRGELCYQGCRTDYEQRFVVDARIDGTRINGTYRSPDGKRSGKVRGTVVMEADPQKANAVSKARCVAFRMGPDKADELWSVPCPYICTHLVPAVSARARGSSTGICPPGCLRREVPRLGRRPVLLASLCLAGDDVKGAIAPQRQVAASVRVGENVVQMPPAGLRRLLRGWRAFEAVWHYARTCTKERSWLASMPVGARA